MATAKKTHTVHEVDESNAQSYIDGFEECYTVLDEVAVKLQNSIEDVRAIYDDSFGFGKPTKQVAELLAMYDALRELRTRTKEAYREKLEELKCDKESYARLRESLVV